MYTWFYGFSEEPFSVTPDPAYLYLTNTHQQALDEMVRAIRERKGYALILGELGSGKTTLIRHLQNTVDPKTLIAAIFHPPGTIEELLEDVLQKVGAPCEPQSKDSLVGHLNDYLHGLSPEETLALVIDEAQEMSAELIEDLRLLPTPENIGSGKLQVLLVGEPKLKGILESERLKEFLETIEVQGEIRPLSEEESRLYISHRLQKADSEISRVFTPDALDLICQYGQGNPRRLNTLCDNSFLIGYGLSKKVVDSTIVSEVVEDLDFVGGEERIAWKSEGARKPKTRTHRIKSSPFRKLAYSLLALGGVGAIILLGRMYLKSPEDPGSTRFPIQLPVSKEIKAPESKPDLVAKAPPQPESEEKTPAGAPEPSSPAIAEKKPIAPTPVAETKSPVPPSPKEIKPSPGKPEPSPVAGEQKPSPKPEPRYGATKPIPIQPAAPRTKVEGVAKKTIIVKGNDSLYSISLQNYGIANTSIVDQILEANPKLRDPNKLANRQSIRLPDIREETLLIPFADGTCQVRLGTFLRPEYAAFLQGEPSFREKTLEVLPRKLPSGETWYRAVAGKFKNREEGLKVVQKLKEKGLSPYFPGFRKKK